jgi:hypothetical protein
MSVAAILASAALTTPAVADKGGEPHQGSNGRGAGAEHAGNGAQGGGETSHDSQSQSQSQAKTEKKRSGGQRAEAKSHSKKAHGSRPKAGRKPSAEPAPKSGEHARAGKTTICHSTGSATNPYVTITVSDNALKAHARHHDGADIIPAPAGGCPKGEKPAVSGKHHGGKDHGRGGKDHGKTTICHSTRSATNPYVQITVSNNALKAHARHHDGADIIPAPAGGCPSAPVTTTTTTTSGQSAAGAGGVVTGQGTGTAPVTTAPVATAPAAAPAGGVLGDFASGGPSTAPAGAVLGEQAAGGSAPAAAGQVLGARAQGGTAPATVTRELGAGGSLPFTGLDLWLLVAAGLGTLLAGIALRRRAVRADQR